MPVPIALAKAALKASGKEKVLDQTLDTALKGAFALSALGGTFFLVRHLFNQVKDDKASKDALTEGKPAYYAGQIGKILHSNFWYGGMMYIDKEALYRTVRAIPREVNFEQIKSAFKDLYGKSLTQELDDKLYPDEYRKILSIVNYGG